MPRYDAYHDVVRRALAKDGWNITADPYLIEYKGFRLQADLAAEKLFVAEKENRQIVVEIKVFGGLSLVNELQKAIGQYAMYRSFLAHVAPAYELFLAVPEWAFQDFFQREPIRELMLIQQMQLLVFDHEQEVITQWTS